MEPLPVVTALPALPAGAALAEASVEELFVAAGALRHGHFLLKSGRHSDRYLEKFAVLQYPALAVQFGRPLAPPAAARGGAARAEAGHAVGMAGATPLQAAVIVGRSGGPVEIGCPILSLGRIEIGSWTAAECPACARGEAVVKPGSSAAS